MVKNPPANADETKETRVLSLSLGRSPGGGHGNPLQCSRLDSPVDRGAWWATVHGVTESDTTERLLHIVSVTTTQPCPCKAEAVDDDVQMNGWLGSNKILFTKTGSGPDQPTGYSLLNAALYNLFPLHQTCLPHVPGG